MARGGQMPPTRSGHRRCDGPELNNLPTNILAKVIDNDESFNFRAYSYTPQAFQSLFEEDIKEISLKLRETVSVKA